MKKLALSLLFVAIFASTIIGVSNACKTQGYWKNHPNAWPLATITIGGVLYTKAQAIAILQTPPEGDATYILAHQLIAAKLNRAMGWIPGAVGYIAEADAFLTAHPLGSGSPGELSETDRDYCIFLAEKLDWFNNIV